MQMAQIKCIRFCIKLDKMYYDCVTWYNLYNLKNVKNTLGGVLLLVNFSKSNTPRWVLFTFFKFYNWYQIAQGISKEFQKGFISA